jgi:hypothetical protein
MGTRVKPLPAMADDDGDEPWVLGSDSSTGDGAAPEGESASFLKRHRRSVLAVFGAAVIFGFVYYVVPQIAGLGPTLRRLRAGNTWWFAFGVLVEALSIVGEIALLRGVFSRPGGRIGWKSSYEITMAGRVATKVFAAAGAGGSGRREHSNQRASGLVAGGPPAIIGWEDHSVRGAQEDLLERLGEVALLHPGRADCAPP